MGQIDKSASENWLIVDISRSGVADATAWQVSKRVMESWIGFEMTHVL